MTSSVDRYDDICWDEYQKVSEIRGFEVFQHMEDKAPKYVFRGNEEMTEGYGDTANNMTDIEILIDEHYRQHLGLGIATGYRRTGNPPAEEIYRDVRIGRYLFRDKAIDLPKFVAVVRPEDLDKSDHKKLRRSAWQHQIRVDGNSVQEVKDRIDEAITVYEPKYRKLFPDKP